jgi:hypothetical protein
MPTVLDSYGWLQLTKDILVPLSSTLVGAGVAYFVARQGSRSQQRIVERERELGVLERVYHLLQEFGRYSTYCRDSYNMFLDDKEMNGGALRAALVSEEVKFDMAELERLIELNFVEFNDAYLNSKKIFVSFLLLLSKADRSKKELVLTQYSELASCIKEIKNMAMERRERVRREVV